jgi:hypothetical protein
MVNLEVHIFPGLSVDEARLSRFTEAFPTRRTGNFRGLFVVMIDALGVLSWRRLIATTVVLLIWYRETLR